MYSAHLAGFSTRCWNILVIYRHLSYSRGHFWLWCELQSFFSNFGKYLLRLLLVGFAVQKFVSLKYYLTQYLLIVCKSSHNTQDCSFN